VGTCSTNGDCADAGNARSETSPRLLTSQLPILQWNGLNSSISALSERRRHVRQPQRLEVPRSVLIFVYQYDTILKRMIKECKSIARLIVGVVENSAFGQQPRLGTATR